jgi:hypothetical protein
MTRVRSSRGIRDWLHAGFPGNLESGDPTVARLSPGAQAQWGSGRCGLAVIHISRGTSGQRKRLSPALPPTTNRSASSVSARLEVVRRFEDPRCSRRGASHSPPRHRQQPPLRRGLSGDVASPVAHKGFQSGPAVAPDALACRWSGHAGLNRAGAAERHEVGDRVIRPEDLFSFRHSSSGRLSTAHTDAAASERRRQDGGATVGPDTGRPPLDGQEKDPDYRRDRQPPDQHVRDHFNLQLKMRKPAARSDMASRGAKQRGSSRGPPQRARWDNTAAVLSQTIAARAVYRRILAARAVRAIPAQFRNPDRDPPPARFGARSDGGPSLGCVPHRRSQVRVCGARQFFQEIQPFLIRSVALVVIRAGR